MLNIKYKIILIIFIILFLLYIIKKYINETFDNISILPLNNIIPTILPTISPTILPTISPIISQIITPINLPIETTKSPMNITTPPINNDIYYKIVLIDNNIRYNLISLSQLSHLYIKKVLQYLITDNNTNLDLLLKNNNIDDIAKLIHSLENKKKYIPNNDIIFAIKESDTFNININKTGFIVSFKNNFSTLYYNALNKYFDDTFICSPNSTAKIYVISDMLSITCSNSNLNKDFDINSIFIDYKENKINSKNVKLINIINSKDQTMPDIYEIVLSSTPSNIKIIKEII
jgi:hypothetical protein